MVRRFFCGLFLAAVIARAAAAPPALTFTLVEELGVARRGEPVVIAGAAVLARLDVAPAVADLRLVSDGEPVPMQVDERDGGPTWAAPPNGVLDANDEIAFLADVSAGGTRKYELRIGGDRPAFANPLTVREYDADFYRRNGYDLTVFTDRLSLLIAAADGVDTPRGQAVETRGRREGMIVGLAAAGQHFGRVELPYTQFQQDARRAWDGRRIVAAGPVRAIVCARLKLAGTYRHQEGSWSVTWWDRATIEGDLYRTFTTWANSDTIDVDDHFLPRQTGDNFTMYYRFQCVPPTPDPDAWRFTRELLVPGLPGLRRQHLGYREHPDVTLTDDQRRAGWLGVRDAVGRGGLAVGYDPATAISAYGSLLVPWRKEPWSPPADSLAYMFVGTYNATVRAGNEGHNRFRIWVLTPESPLPPDVRRRAELAYPLLPRREPPADPDLAALDADLEALAATLTQYRYRLRKATRDQGDALAKRREALAAVAPDTPVARRHLRDEIAALHAAAANLRASYDLRRLALMTEQPNARAPHLAVFPADTMVKIRPHGPIPATAQPVAIAAARGEAEGFQLVLATGPDIVRGLTVTVDDFVGPGGAVIPAAGVRRYRVGYLPRPVGDGTVDLENRWPDPLVPLPGCPGYPAAAETLFAPELTALGTLPAHECSPFWFTVEIPRDAAPGAYAGQIRLRIDDRELAVPVSLTVDDFTLPEQPSTMADIWFSNGLGFMRYYGRDCTVEEFAGMAEWLRGYRVGVQLSWLTCTQLVEVRIDADGNYRFDFSKLDPWLEVALKDNRWFNANLGCGAGWTAHYGGVFGRRTPILDERTGKTTLFPPAPIAEMDMIDHPLWRQFWAAYAAHLEERGWLDRCYVENIDEPPYGPGYVDRDRNVFLRKFHAALREVAPGFRLFNYGMSPSPHYHEWAIPYVDVWGPNLSGLDDSLAALRTREAAGQPFLTYVCGGRRQTPEFHTPDVYVDDPGIDLRTIPWMVWRYGAMGVLYYAGNGWVGDPSRHLVASEPRERWPARPWRLGGAGFGNGWFTYPAPKTLAVWPSVRLENIRDGLEDYEYLRLLARRAPNHPLIHLDDAFRSVLIWPTDPDALRARRAAVAAAIVNPEEPAP